MPATYVKIANLMGPEGREGPRGATGTFADADAVAVRPDELDLKPRVSGPQEARKIVFRVRDGMPGVDAVPAMEAVATYIGGARNVQNALGRTYARSAGVAVERFLGADERFEDAPMPFLQRAYNNVDRSYGPVAVLAPPGIFPVDSPLNITTARRDVSLLGAGSSLTRFVLGRDCFALVSGYGDSTTGRRFDGLLMGRFTIDASAQVGQPNASMKGLNIGHIFNSRFEDIEIINSWATAFGIDFLVNVVIENCGATGAGRGVNKESLLGFGSGFGIGTGAYVNESMFLRNIRTKGSGRMGINLEWLHEYGQYFDTQIFIDGWHSDGDAVGLGDLGNGGLHMANALIEYFTAAGLVVGPGGQAPQGGRLGHIARSVRIRKGAKTAANRPDQDIYGAHAIVLRGDGAGGYNLEATVENNEGAALYVEPGFRLTAGGLRVALNARRNGKAVDWRAGGRMEDGVVFEDGYYEDNGIGLDLRTSLRAPTITRNTFKSTGGGQKIAVRFDPTMPVLKGIVEKNVALDTDVMIDGRGPLIDITDDNRKESTSTDPSLVFFDQMTAFPDTNSLGIGWMAATKGAFTQSHVWGRGRYGAQPKPGGTGNSGAGVRYRDCGGLGYSISAWIDPPSDGIGRRGVVASYDPDTGVCIVFENSQNVYQVARYDASGTRTVVASTSVPTSTRAHIEIRQSATGNSFWFYLNGELIRDVFNTSLVPKTRYAGMFGLASADAWISALAIRPIAA